MKKKLEQLQTDKAKNEKEYAEWQASCEAWKKSHANHPNKELFNKYNEEVLIFLIKILRVLTPSAFLSLWFFVQI